MSAEDAATLIMSCGVVQPGSDQQKKAQLLPAWRTPRGSPTADSPDATTLQPAPVKVKIA